MKKLNFSSGLNGEQENDKNKEVKKLENHGLPFVGIVIITVTTVWLTGLSAGWW